MDDIAVKRRAIFFNNLTLLGLDKLSLEKKYGISFHKDMFTRPNKKGYEVVTYFLFVKLSLATGKDYNIPWPLVCKEHDRTFQKTAYSHLMSFSQENCVKFPRMVLSLLLTFGGDRFYKVYLAFSSHVLYKTMKKNEHLRLLSVPSISRESYSTSKEILQLSTVLNMKKFRETEVMSHQSHLIWATTAKNLEKSLGKLKSTLKSNEELIKKKKMIVLDLYSTECDRSFNLSKIIETCFENLKPVLKQRKVLDKFLSSEQRYWQHLCTEVGENAESEFLNGQDYRIQVTDYLPEKYVKVLKNVGCISSNENGKLSVERFIKIFMAYLTFIVDLLKKENFNDLHKACFVENVSAIEDDLNCIKHFNKKLSDDIIPHVEKNIDKLKILNGYDDIEENVEPSTDQFCPLPILSFDIEAIEQRTSHFDANLENIFSLSSKQFCSERNDDSVFLFEKNPIEHSLKDQNIASSSSSFITSDVFSVRVVAPSSSTPTERKFMDHSNIKDIPVTSPTSSSNTHMSVFDDLDFSSSRNFKMRDSWLHEESLFSMTLPDTPLDD